MTIGTRYGKFLASILGAVFAFSGNGHAQSSAVEREKVLLERIAQLEKRLADVESRLAAHSKTESPSQAVAPPVKTGNPVTAGSSGPPEAKGESASNFLRDTALGITLDGHYTYNFNRPIGRVNLGRGYDSLSNSFSLNQAGIVVERAPDPEKGRRFGARLDLQYGQATETLQGNAANELRPQVYRPLFQVYGTYVAPIGKGLTVDFGKWASALGLEGNYTKDQMNYSRSFWFNVISWYHFGFRTTYQFNEKFSVTHWLVNGLQQSEDGNGFKSQAVFLGFTPSKRLSWNLNYYSGVEGRDTVPALNPGLPELPTQPGLSVNAVRPAPNGRSHIFDAYATWNATDHLTLAGEFDWVLTRAFRSSQPQRVTDEAAYFQYRFTPKFALAARAEYLSDRGGFFSGATQILKETTLTADYRVADGFLVRSEWRRDFSNRPFFLTDVPGFLKKEQNTLTLGLIWWFGKEGRW